MVERFFPDGKGEILIYLLVLQDMFLPVIFLVFLLQVHYLGLFILTILIKSYGWHHKKKNTINYLPETFDLMSEEEYLNLCKYMVKALPSMWNLTIKRTNGVPSRVKN
jgi:hypothetical protein